MKHLIGGTYYVKEKLGQGQFGYVYKGEHKDTKQLVAIKLMNLQNFKNTPMLQKLMENEIKILQSISHPNIIKLFDYGNYENFKYLIYEYCNGGNLEEEILSKKRPISSNFLLRLFIQMISGYVELAKNNILHRDLKPQNILLHNNIVKIADFGFSKAHNTEQELTKTVLGSPLYMAPEVLFHWPYNQQADVWSLGICLYELLFGQCPIQGRTTVELSNRMMKLQHSPIQIPSTTNIDSTIRNLLQKMIVFEANKRCTWQELEEWKNKIEAKISEQQLQSVMQKNIKINRNQISQRVQDEVEKNFLQQFHKCWYCIQLEFKILNLQTKFKNIIEPFFIIMQICEGSFLAAQKVKQQIKVEKYLNDTCLTLFELKLDELKRYAVHAKNNFIEIAKSINDQDNFEFSEYDKNQTLIQNFSMIFKFFRNISNSLEEQTYLKITNQIIDALIFDEIFNNLYDHSKNFNEQQYLNLDSFTNRKLEQMLKNKLNYVHQLTLK